MKVITPTSNISAFGGLNFTDKLLKDLEFRKDIRQQKKNVG
ncbi:MAG: hypothetical protein ACI86M_002332 [Saprospiraceae bacterium]|jgi:hypothetical protein